MKLKKVAEVVRLNKAFLWIFVILFALYNCNIKTNTHKQNVINVDSFPINDTIFLFEVVEGGITTKFIKIKNKIEGELVIFEGNQMQSVRYYEDGIIKTWYKFIYENTGHRILYGYSINEDSIIVVDTNYFIHNYLDSADFFGYTVDFPYTCCYNDSIRKVVIKEHSSSGFSSAIVLSNYNSPNQEILSKDRIYFTGSYSLDFMLHTRKGLYKAEGFLLIPERDSNNAPVVRRFPFYFSLISIDVTKDQQSLLRQFWKDSIGINDIKGSW